MHVGFRVRAMYQFESHPKALHTPSGFLECACNPLSGCMRRENESKIVEGNRRQVVFVCK